MINRESDPTEDKAVEPMHPLKQPSTIDKYEDLDREINAFMK